MIFWCIINIQDGMYVCQKVAYLYSNNTSCKSFPPRKKNPQFS
jgi:hypothetical protein